MFCNGCGDSSLPPTPTRSVRLKVVFSPNAAAAYITPQTLVEAWTNYTDPDPNGFYYDQHWKLGRATRGSDLNWASPVVEAPCGYTLSVQIRCFQLEGTSLGTFVVEKYLTVTETEEADPISGVVEKYVYVNVAE